MSTRIHALTYVQQFTNGLFHRSVFRSEIVSTAEKLGVHLTDELQDGSAFDDTDLVTRLQQLVAGVGKTR